MKGNQKLYVGRKISGVLSLLLSLNFPSYHSQSLLHSITLSSLKLYVPCIVSNSINKPTRCTFCMYLFYNLFATLHVSNVYFIHHQEFINLLYLQLCTNHANVPKCSVSRSVPTVRSSSHKPICPY